MRLLLWLFDRLLVIALLVVVVTMVAGRDVVEATAGRLLDGLVDAGAVPASVARVLPYGDDGCSVAQVAIEAGGRWDYGLAARAGKTVRLSLAVLPGKDDAGEIGLSLVWPLGTDVRDYGRIVAVEELTILLTASGGYTVRLDNGHDATAAKTVELRLCMSGHS